MSLPILYTFRRCPYAIRARMALVYAGIDFEIREVLLREKPQEMLNLSPKGTVPVLQLGDGTVLEESFDIMKWSVTESDPEHWYPKSLSEQEEIESLINENDTVFKEALDGYKYPKQNPQKSALAWRDAGLAFLVSLEERLKASKYLIGDSISLADVALFPFVRQFANVDREWFEAEASLKCLREWLKGFLESPLFLGVMQKYTPWKLGDEPIRHPRGRGDPVLLDAKFSRE